VPYVAGGATDLVSRTVAERLAAALGQQVVVDNRPGATGTIAFDIVAKSSPDGYTLITATDSITVLPSVFSKLPFDPRTSFVPVALMSTQPLVVAVHVSQPAVTMKEFIALAKARPGTLSFGSSGTGTSQHLTGELIKKATGIDMTHVPYKGGGQAIIDLAGGQVPAAVLGSSTVIPQVKAGKVRILAVTSKACRPAQRANPCGSRRSGYRRVSVDGDARTCEDSEGPYRSAQRRGSESPFTTGCARTAGSGRSRTEKRQPQRGGNIDPRWLGYVGQIDQGTRFETGLARGPCLTRPASYSILTFASRAMRPYFAISS
jgi:hypothetical protein